MAKHSRLQRRNGRYYVRAKVPADLVAIVGMREIKWSLDTADPKDALEKVRVASVKVDAILAEARRKLNAVPVETVSETQIEQLVIGWLWELERGEEAHRKATPALTAEALAEQRQMAAEDLAEIAHAQAIGDPNPGLGIARKLLERHHIRLDPNAPELTALCRRVVQAMREHGERRSARLMGQMVPRAFDPVFDGVFAHAPPPQAQPVPSAITLSTLIDRYMADPARANLSGKTRDGYVIIHRVLKQTLGADKPLDAISREDCRRVRDIICSLPPNATKLFPGKSLEEAAALGREQGLPTLSPKSVNSYLNNLSALFNYAVTEDYLDKNPAKGLSVAAADEHKRDKKKPFSIDQLKAIFAAPLYTGCADDASKYAEPQPGHIVRRGRFWVPLLSLFHGMRLNECCQLLVSDIEARDGYDCIIVRPEDIKRVKTTSSNRTFPIHPEILRLGFMDHVRAARKAGHDRLFPELSRGANGYFSDPFQKWFSRFLTSAKATAPKTSFHSFRHSWATAADRVGMTPRARLEIGGWTTGANAAEIYVDRLPPSALAEELAKIAYPGLVTLLRISGHL